MKKLMLMLSATVLVAACNKEEKPCARMQHTASPAWRSMPAAIPDENSAGEWHNYYLDQAYSMLENDITMLGYENLTVTDIHNTMEKITNGIIKGNDSAYHRHHAISIGSAYLNGDGLPANIIKTQREINQSGMSATLKNGLSNLWQRCDTVTTKTGATSVAATFKTWAGANPNLSAAEKQIAIGTADVFEASFAYWDDNIDKWNALLSNNKGGDNSPQTKVSLGKADAAGFSVGATIGAYGGSVVLPGVGTFSGWLGGGIAGGLNGSVGAAFANLWDWMFG